MVTFEQIKLLDSKITRVLGYVNRLTEENLRLKTHIAELTEKTAKLQEENNKIEKEFASALEKLNKFEDAIEQSLSSVKAGINPAQNTVLQRENAPPVSGPPAPPVTPLEVKLSAPEVSPPIPETSAASLAYMVDEEDTANDADDTDAANEADEPEDVTDTEDAIEEDIEEESGTDDSDGEELELF